ncbi:MAG: acyl-ACP--UDP-N-acetylglucosamine O-acyltransferase [Pseudomonadota bacterium]
MSIHPSAKVHTSAVVEDGAVIGEDCEIGAFSLIGSEVRMGARNVLHSHSVVKGDTEIGDDNEIFSFAVVGEIPQDKKFDGEKTKLVIGNNNRIREHVTINTGTVGGGSLTKIGDHCLLMAGCHVAHDVIIHNNVIVVNSVALGGHSIIEDDVIIGGLSGIHQFVRIGKGAIIGAVTMVAHDVIPYGLVQGPRGMLDGLNLVGLKRRGVDRSDIMALRAAFQMMAQGEGTFADRVKRMGQDTDSNYVQDIVAFVTGESGRAFLTPGD